MPQYPIMKIREAVFSGSSKKLTDRPERKLPEFAFIGRSNVGKSSLINMLCNQSKLAHTSSKPGKTRLINHFLVNDLWYLVDLPGYGYAKVSHKERDELAKIVEGYINGSEELVSLFVLLDSRLDIQKIDLNFINRLGEAGIPFSIIFTKGDKLGPTALKNQIQKNSEILLQFWEELPPIFISSSTTGAGKEEILQYIENSLNTINS